MVARTKPIIPAVRDAISAFSRTVRAWFFTWRVLLTRALRTPAQIGRQIRYHPRPDMVLAFVKRPEETLRAEEDAPTRLAAIGVRAFTAGALIYFAALTIGGMSATGALARVAGAIAWAAVRLGIMLFYAHDEAAERPVVITGWAVGLMPYLLGATAGLRVIAFLASAIYTDAALSGNGIERQKAHSLVLRSFGAQAIVLTVTWAFRAITTAIVLVGGSL